MVYFFVNKMINIKKKIWIYHSFGIIIWLSCCAKNESTNPILTGYMNKNDIMIEIMYD